MNGKSPTAAREVLHRWSGQVMETADGLALPGRMPGEGHVYVATGDSGMGMTHACLGAVLIADLIHGVQVPWAALYDPDRRVPSRAVAAYGRTGARPAQATGALASLGGARLG